MLAPIRRGLGLALAIYLLGQTSPAFACACCTNEGQRNVATVALDSGKQHEIESLRFGSKATLFTGEGEVEGIQGIATPAGTYKLSAQWREDRLVLSFRDAADHTGTLSLARPPTISVFEVDPRDRPDRGQGPTLYKEWKLSAPASGSGVFQPGIARQQILTLILQGGGNSCTSGVDFTHWTLVMQGPKANYTLYGNLVR
ncbi:hypothetical protein [Bradyrhizobium sp. AUGA SZCCT0431]|uniref:hypothetical protein n=1 Tax=Bradyrhizobium sp. AUGA SZCCT0431 TaxID=2807674 RepID=UPI001BA9AF57|nr:hypothetical protein [Bradyrhizobium sp. AUGA SZCCT0431]MBR1144414.1 hypothetical protein [Bradyrhizobium sp. AUGA SZCCT0431]